MIETPPGVSTVPASLGQFAIAALLGGEIDDHRAGFHQLHHVDGDEDRRAFPEDLCSGDHHVHLWQARGDASCSFTRNSGDISLA